MYYIYCDEAGDVGQKLNEGSSRYFILSMVVVENHQQATKTEERIMRYKVEAGKSPNFEYHFAKNSDRDRLGFLNSFSKLDFLAFSLIIDKAAPAMKAPIFRRKDSFYFYAFNLLFASAAPFLSGQPLVITLDESGSKKFQTGMRKYLKELQQDNQQYNIKTIRQKQSDKDSLLQLADYISGVVNRKAVGKKGWEKYYKFIENKLLVVTHYP